MVEVANLVKEFDGFRALDGYVGKIWRDLWSCWAKRSGKVDAFAPSDRNLQAK